MQTTNTEVVGTHMSKGTNKQTGTILHEIKQQTIKLALMSPKDIVVDMWTGREIIWADDTKFTTRSDNTKLGIANTRPVNNIAFT